MIHISHFSFVTPSSSNFLNEVRVQRRSESVTIIKAEKESFCVSVVIQPITHVAIV
jgi:hypothetical protein